MWKFFRLNGPFEASFYEITLGWMPLGEDMEKGLQLGGHLPRPPSLQTGVNGKLLKIPLTGNGCWSMRNYFISSPNMSFILPTFSENIDAEMTSIAFSVWSGLKEFEICRPCEIYHTEQQLKRSTCFEFLCHCVWHLSFLESYIHR